MLVVNNFLKVLWTLYQSLQKINKLRYISPDANLETKGVGMGKTSTSHGCTSSTSPLETGGPID